MLALFYIKVSAQQNLYSDRTLTTTANFDLKKYNSNKNKTAGVFGEWFNYGNAINALGTSTAVLNPNYLFPDSLAYGEFGAGNFAPCWIHHLGDVLDVKGFPFIADPLTTFTSFESDYLLDSMALVYRYTRNHPNPAIVDTLVVTLFTAANVSNLLSSILTGSIASNYGTDTVSYRKIKYNQAINTVSATSVYWFKILLKMGDTADVSYREKAFRLPVPYIVCGGKLLASDIQFKPGYSYPLGDHIDYVANSFFFASFEEKGISTFPNYYDCNAGSSTCDWNSSSIVSSQVRYNLSPTWNGSFIPSYANPASYPYEHHLISYHIFDYIGICSSGISELEINNFTLGQNIPNPFNSGSSISYELINEAKSVMLTITDIMGRIISSEQTAHTKGIHTINIKQFDAGVYYYSLNVDGKVITKKNDCSIILIQSYLKIKSPNNFCYWDLVFSINIFYFPAALGVGLVVPPPFVGAGLTTPFVAPGITAAGIVSNFFFTNCKISSVGSL